MKTNTEKVMQVIRELESGNNVYHDEKTITKRCRGTFPEMNVSAVYTALTELCEAGLLVREGGTYAITETRYDEDYLAQAVARYITDNEPRDRLQPEEELRRAETAMSICLSRSQRAAVIGSLSHRLSVITGGPGSGKTTMMQALCAALPDAAPSDIMLLAPTGKAARHLAEQTGREATTVHAGIYEGLSTRKYDNGTLTPRLLVVDEASMLSIRLLADLLRSVSDAVRVVLVGDPDQLPAVGAGQVLRDLLGSTLPVYQLSDNFRQQNGSQLADAVELVRLGRTDLQYDGQTLDLVPTASVQDAELLTQSLYTTMYQMGVQAQILTPYGDAGGPCSTVSLNAVIRDRVNPRTPAKLEAQIDGKTYRQGDEVIVCSNYRDVKNGDMGRIVGVGSADEVCVDVEFDFLSSSVRFTQAEIESRHLLDHAYAITVHKSQGSEYDTVIIPLLPHHKHMWCNNMIYTALSRARKKVYLVGDADVLNYAIQTPLEPSNSLLLQKIRWNLPPVAV